MQKWGHQVTKSVLATCTQCVCMRACMCECMHAMNHSKVSLQFDTDSGYEVSSYGCINF